ncbi:enoyl-[acyl-carrier-protein] reductase [NADH] [Lactobacillus nasalidis]|uniref:Enoyl-[acyl-carrier-protein] reductase [NADH] n=2 Tax=Lactobacillus nasalidis TaxID=2797258 RepID=A0ABQ3W4R8_9LACO|nr:enoyl-[acyl-carrier-protein] reductase [NADH] [Lactobacillus nasalidis]
MGVANKRSIAWGCAQQILAQGGEVIYSYQNERLQKNLLKLGLPADRMVECDVASDESIDAAFDQVKAAFGQIDGLVHAVAFAPKNELEGSILNSTRDGYLTAQNISSYSLIAVAKAAKAKQLLAEKSSIVTLTFIGSERAVTNYNTMGIAKAALESSVRYLARDLGKTGTRVNAISAGAMKTLAVTGIGGHKDLLEQSRSLTVDGVNVSLEELGNCCAFLLSDLSSGLVGDVIYVDKGVHLS